MSASTKLPTPSGSVGTWGAELNDFLGQSMVASTTAGATNGLLKTDHAAITDGGKVGIGTGSPVTIFEVKNQGAGVATTTLGGQTTISGTDSSSSSAFNYGTTEDTYLRSGKASSNMYIQDQPGAGDTRINPKNGNLAVGTSSAPVKKLDVAGGIRSSVYRRNIY